MVFNEPIKKKGPRFKNIEYEIKGECWVCISHAQLTGGYMRVYRNKQFISMHRYIYIISNGEIPDGKVIMHTCDNRLCINPSHLKVGTQLENIQDMHSKNRNNTTKGYKHTQEAKDKISKANSGRTIWNKGIPLSEESKQKMRETRKRNKELKK